ELGLEVTRVRRLIAFEGSGLQIAAVAHRPLEEFRPRDGLREFRRPTLLRAESAADGVGLVLGLFLRLGLWLMPLPCVIGPVGDPAGLPSALLLGDAYDVHRVCSLR